MNKDELTGKTDSVKGRVKEAAGVLLDNDELEKEGGDERAQGEVREAIGKARRRGGEAIEDLGNRIKR